MLVLVLQYGTTKGDYDSVTYYIVTNLDILPNSPLDSSQPLGAAALGRK